MARRDAILRLHKILQARQEDLHQILTEELTNLRVLEEANSAGDSADAAFAAGSQEMSSLLAEVDARELSQIERVLERLKQGVYGLCESKGAHCQHKIPVARLNALPYTTCCINCGREKEKTYDLQGRGDRSNWDQVFDPEAPMKNQRINLCDLEKNQSGNRGE